MMTKIQRMNFISECQEPKDQQRLARASIFLLIAFHARPVCRETEGSALSHPIPGRHGGHPSVYLGWPIGQIAAARGSHTHYGLPLFRGGGFFEVTRAGWVQDMINKEVATISMGLKV